MLSELDSFFSEKEIEDDELTIPAGVWSDKAPFFTDDVPPVESEKQVFRKARATGNCPTYQEAYNSMIALKSQSEYLEGTTWTNFEPYGSKGGYHKFSPSHGRP